MIALLVASHPRAASAAPHATVTPEVGGTEPDPALPVDEADAAPLAAPDASEEPETTDPSAVDDGMPEPDASATAEAPAASDEGAEPTPVSGGATPDAEHPTAPTDVGQPAPSGVPGAGDDSETTADAPSFAPELDRRQRVAFGVVGGVLTLAGIGLAGASVYSMLQGRKLRNDVDAMLDGDPMYLMPGDAAELDARLQRRADAIVDGRRHNRIAIATGVTGGIAFGTGVALLILGARRPNQTRLSPMFSRRMAGLILRRRF